MVNRVLMHLGSDDERVLTRAYRLALRARDEAKRLESVCSGDILRVLPADLADIVDGAPAELYPVIRLLPDPVPLDCGAVLLAADLRHIASELNRAAAELEAMEGGAA